MNRSQSNIRFNRLLSNIAAILFTIVTFFFILSTNGCGTRVVRSVHDNRVSDSLSHAQFVEITFEKQLSEYGCGIAVLVSALKYWDIPVDQEQLAKQYPPKLIQDGYTIGELKAIAHEQGLHAFALKSDLITIKKHLQKGRPIIVPVEVDSDYIIDQSLPFLGFLSRIITKQITPSYHHYIIVFGFNKMKIWLMDPVFGIISIDEDKFLKIWSKKGYSMILVSR